MGSDRKISISGSHEKVFRTSPVIVDALDSCLDEARRWLDKTHIRLPTGVSGWAMSSERHDLTVWGGTIDGIRALTALGVPPTKIDLQDGINWIKDQQLPSGGFNSCEIDYVAAESTAWTLIMLGELGFDASTDEVAQAAVEYLTKCVGPTGGVSTTPADTSEPRTMPTAIALWAFSLHSNTEQIRSRLVEWLRNIQDPDSHGWGVALGATPNATTTAQVLHALCTARIYPEVDWMRYAADYIISRQEDDGSWINGYEEWFTVARPRTPYRCLNYGPAWGLLALTNFQYADARVACLRAVRYLTVQQKEGAWQYDSNHSIRYVWCVSQCIIALKTWRDQRNLNDARMTPTFAQRAELVLGDNTVMIRDWLRSNFTYFMISALFAAEFRNDIGRDARATLAWLDLSRISIINNVVSSLLWLMITLLGAFTLKRIAGRR